MSGLRFVPMRPDDLPRIVLGHDQAETFGKIGIPMDADYGDILLQAGPCWTGIDDDGQVVGAAGFCRAFPTQASAWALFGEQVRRHRIEVVRFIRARIEAAPWVRIEALTRADVPAQGRFARACGLTWVATLRCCGATCESMELYEKVADAR